MTKKERKWEREERMNKRKWEREENERKWEKEKESAISNGREPKSCLGRVFNFKLGQIAILRKKYMKWHSDTSRVENLAQG